MSNSRPNKYWLGKVKLWIALHGGWKGVANVDFCTYCRFFIERKNITAYDTIMNRWGRMETCCKRKSEMRGRLMAKKDLSSIKFNPHVNLGDNEHDYFCVEWVKDV